MVAACLEWACCVGAAMPYSTAHHFKGSPSCPTDSAGAGTTTLNNQEHRLLHKTSPTHIRRSRA